MVVIGSNVLSGQEPVSTKPAPRRNVLSNHLHHSFTLGPSVASLSINAGKLTNGEPDVKNEAILGLEIDAAIGGVLVLVDAIVGRDGESAHELTGTIVDFQFR